MLRSTIPALPLHIVLLLVAFFNALAGVPLHEARHIQEVVASATASTAAGDVDAYATDTPATGEHSESTPTTCAWCLSHALEAGLAHAPAAGQLPLPATPSTLRPQSADPFTVQQVRWPFAARDPPPAQRA
ncbi:hypothetical protein ASF11_23880 [Acidovorax sp. Leaf76]|uniref:DUF2946 family protein n=1 Tax=unclassified Acidovorax TaxID=2684926 RepID=UPI0006F5C1F3|nr:MULTISPECIES: DUF2946 family protein [unclassified Acidovorax]KQO23169.1 hypothetical protein ASF11_23880 [Acidovorax sp. Leaf76]KQO31744.1 hypothetical protein ASF19_09100 [Acidovorax sp. Leaf84]KQS37558.1 hypothetical protein ASG27_24200 [Acidovorax sp. Leaf191]